MTYPTFHKTNDFYKQLLLRYTPTIPTRLWVIASIILIALFIVNSSYIFALTFWSDIYKPSYVNIFMLIYANVGLLIMLFIIIAIRAIRSFLTKKWRGKLQIKLLVIFSLIASLPAIAVMIFSLIFLDLGLENWFSNKVRQALNASSIVAEAYLEEHINNIGSDAFNVARRFDRDYLTATTGQQQNISFMTQLLAWYGTALNIEEAYIFNSNDVLARYGLTYSLELQTIQKNDLIKANRGEVIIRHDEDLDRIRAMVALDSIIDGYLVVARYIDPTVLNHVNATNEAVSGYQFIELKRFNTKLSFSIIFIIITLILLTGSVLYGIHFATAISARLYKLAAGAQHITQGRLITINDNSKQRDEISYLFIMFNRMIKRLSSQRKKIHDVTEQIDERRRFIETILANVSAGIIGLTPQGHIKLVNKKASELLAHDMVAQTHKHINDIIPSIADLWHQACTNTKHESVQDAIIVTTADGDKTLLIKISIEGTQQNLNGYIVTFDDVSNLIQAQHQAAWSEVARRIAHEVKNPLTPIQLAAERIKRKYAHLIDDDDPIFNQCVNTIIRQVDDLGLLIDEFSHFARMPAPKMAEHNMIEIIREILFLEENHHYDISYEFIYDKTIQHHALCDKSLSLQAITNILKNAREAIIHTTHRGNISVTVTHGPQYITIQIDDDGPGFPDNIMLNDYTKPYITTKEDGTGLGLSIVKKIMHDQQGRLTIENIKDDTHNIMGARIILDFIHFIE